MANFYMTLPAEEISRQISILLNTHNQLRKRYNANSVMGMRGAYFVDVIGGQVIGCSAIIRENDQVTRQFHLCVHPDFRRRGIARNLKLAALKHVSTPYVYVTIREDNVASINLNTSVGFAFVKKDWSHDHYVLTLGRMMTDVRSPATGLDLEECRSIAAHGSSGRDLFGFRVQSIK
jgi:RimJ/RimL family protein N-acetyltransferase